ncbi:hypothetical protein [Chryseobacterium nepalense]|uniref:Uncharacterized protein n=1 Tax=Chryseobacterium nepalense TaxID=1854498 RepID=A0ABY4KCE8_9FLAO|nr:hypothetical protein [Chryseobacterium nepalense]UPQ77473.1 hypothetical protein M0D58_08040 [Chryseobacterium nepalense]
MIILLYLQLQKRVKNFLMTSENPHHRLLMKAVNTTAAIPGLKYSYIVKAERDFPHRMT